MFNVLEGDGVIENIYHFLWTKDTIFNTDPYVIIPQTILYGYRLAPHPLWRARPIYCPYWL